MTTSSPAIYGVFVFHGVFHDIFTYLQEHTQVCRIFVACCVLHNIAITVNMPLPQGEDVLEDGDATFVHVQPVIGRAQAARQLTHRQHLLQLKSLLLII